MNQKPSPVKISKLMLSKFNYDDEGNDFEKLYWPSIKNRFLKIEELWKYFVPMTNRVILNKNDNYYTDHREDVDIKIKKIAIVNFSIFFHIICAKESFNSPADMKFFKYFYINLGVICDLINSIFYRIIHLFDILKTPMITNNLDINKINQLGNQIEIFIENDENTNLESKEQKKLIANILKYFFHNNQIIDDYINFSKSVSIYRNVIVHQANIHPIPYKGEFIVPNEDKINDYKIRLHAAYEIERISDLEKTRDFKEVGTLLKEDFNRLSININNLWERIISIFDTEIFANKNKRILNLYNITVE